MRVQYREAIDYRLQDYGLALLIKAGFAGQFGVDVSNGMVTCRIKGSLETAKAVASALKPMLSDGERILLDLESGDYLVLGTESRSAYLQEQAMYGLDIALGAMDANAEVSDHDVEMTALTLMCALGGGDMPVTRQPNSPPMYLYLIEEAFARRRGEVGTTELFQWPANNKWGVVAWPEDSQCQVALVIDHSGVSMFNATQLKAFFTSGADMPDELCAWR